jgi:hypothetical protein
MTAKTEAQRKAAERQRRSEAGLVRLELYARPEHHKAIKEHAATLAINLPDGTKRLTDEQCDAFRRLPASFNDMVRAIFEAGRQSAPKGRTTSRT